MIRILGVLLAVIFAILSLFHLYWAVGGGFGSGVVIPTVGGQPLLNPSPFWAILVAAALFAALLVVLGRVKIWGALVPGWIFYLGTWLISLLFLLRAIGEFRYVGFFKSVTDTNFARWDTILFSPLCLVISVIAYLISYYGVRERKEKARRQSDFKSFTAIKDLFRFRNINFRFIFEEIVLSVKILYPERVRHRGGLTFATEGDGLPRVSNLTARD